MPTKWDKKLRKVEENVYQLDKEGSMNVPVKIFASEKLLEKIKEDDSIQQGINVACMPGIQKQSIMMSDAHLGYGFSVGGVAAFDTECGCISPGGIGFDINCGVRLLTTNLTKKDIDKKIKEIINALFESVPSGVGSESKLRLSDEDYEEVLNSGLDWCLKNEYATKEDLENKKAVIVSKSNVFYKPLEKLLKDKKIKVEIIKPDDNNLSNTTKKADILITAIGKPFFIKEDMVKEDSIIIDIGTNKIDDKYTVGDIDYTNVFQKVKHITPVPGGVGPMTVAMLLYNTLKLYKNKKGY